MATDGSTGDKPHEETVHLPAIENLIDSGSFPSSPLDPSTGALTTRTSRLKRVTVLAVIQDPLVTEILAAHMATDQFDSFDITVTGDVDKARTLLSQPGWGAFIFDEATYGVIGFLKEADRFHALRHALLVCSDDSDRSSAQLTVAETIPLSHLTIFSLDNALTRIGRVYQNEKSATEREVIQDVLWRIARGSIDSSPDLTGVLRPLVQAAVQVVAAEKVYIWKFEEKPLRLRCLTVYDSSGSEDRQLHDIPAESCPIFCVTMSTSRILAVPHIDKDHRTSELGALLLHKEGIASLLCAPIFMDGTFSGIFAVGSAQPDREWHESDRSSISKLADYAHLSMVAYHKQVAQNTVKEHLAISRRRTGSSRSASWPCR